MSVHLYEISCSGTRMIRIHADCLCCAVGDVKGDMKLFEDAWEVCVCVCVCVCV